MFVRKQGFTLVEIMIVVAIIALLAAIAIPNLLRSRLNAAETNAQAVLRTLSTASESYATAHSQGHYPTTMADLTDPTPAYIHEDYTNEIQQGYDITVESQLVGEYYFGAIPTGAFANGGRAFAICTGGIFVDSKEASTTVPVCPPVSEPEPEPEL